MRRIALRRIMLGVIVCTSAIVSTREVRAQTLTVTSNTVGNVTPTVADFISGGTNLGTSKIAGVMALNLTGCKKDTVCRIRISATTVPTAGALNWSLTSAGSPDANFSCAPGSPSSGALTTTPTNMLVCTAGGGANNKDVTGIQVTFSYPVSWTGTPFGTYTTSGITFTLSTP